MFGCTPPMFSVPVGLRVECPSADSTLAKRKENTALQLNLRGGFNPFQTH